jgi:hypothetical protein
MYLGLNLEEQPSAQIREKFELSTELTKKSELFLRSDGFFLIGTESGAIS